MSNGNEASLALNEDRFNLLLNAASMYYEEGLTQQEISRRLGYSRSGISRLLSEAREAGIVEIRVHHPLMRNGEIERLLNERFVLREARILTSNSLPYAKLLRRNGELTARFLEQTVRSDSVIGVSWGTNLNEVAYALRPPRYSDITVVQLVGALGTPDPQIDGPELAQWFAQRFGGRYRTLPTPLIVDNAEVREALMNDRQVREVLNLARQVDVAIVGIGSVVPELSSLVRAGYLTPDEINEVAASGAVGDVCAIQFDIDGNVLDLPISRRVVGVEADTLRQIPLVLGIAAGKVKAPAILGALRAGLINGLVTDDVAAREVLRLGNNQNSG